MKKEIVWVYSVTKKFLWFKYQKEMFRVVKESDGLYYPEKLNYLKWNKYWDFGYPLIFITHTISYDTVKNAIDYIKFHEKLVDISITT